MGEKMMEFDELEHIHTVCEKCRLIATRQPIYIEARNLDSEISVPEHMAWPCPRCGHHVLSKCADDR